jgi:uncharacterized protein YgiM (DUF1202 family)
MIFNNFVTFKPNLKQIVNEYLMFVTFRMVLRRSTFMINGTAVKVSLCLSAVFLSISIPATASAATRTSDVGVAGITQTLDLYYSTTSEKEPGEAEQYVEALALQNETDSKLTKVESPYANLGISIADNYVNIRKDPNTESEVVGKLYKGCATDILETNGQWVKIKSGNVKGYINAEFLAIGTEAEGLIDNYATKYATINTQTLFVREKPNKDAAITTQKKKNIIALYYVIFVEYRCDIGERGM